MKRRFSLVAFSVAHPRLVLALCAGLSAVALLPLSRVRTDTNPKNMLPPTSAVRVSNAEVEKTFGLYEDMIAVGIRNDDGVLNPGTLARLKRITEAILALEGVAARDVTSFVTVTNVSADAGTLRVAPLMTAVPETPQAIESLRKSLFSNPMLLDRLIARDGKTTAIYVPLEKGANGKEIADRIREIVGRESGPERYYVAGDPVARDTFGAVMFRLMAVFSPISGMVMFLAIFVMFRNLLLAFSMMGVSMIAVLWSVGLLVALGFPIHIMSSMSPVFLMAIATDSIHIFNEFYFRFREGRDKRQAIVATMEAVSRPVRYTALATAAGFAVLLFMQIIPVKTFGGLVAFGTIVLRVLSFSFIPAVLSLASEERLRRGAARQDAASDLSARLLRGLTAFGLRRRWATLGAGAVLLVVAIVGTSRIVVNNNMVEWFEAGSEIRVADRVLNESLGGTSLGYLVAESPQPEFFKNPEALRALEGLQKRLEKLPVVGKTTSVADIVKRIHRVLHDDQAAYQKVPDDSDTVGQYVFLFQMAAKPSDLDNVVDYGFQKANIWVQLRTWDAAAMRHVLAETDRFSKSHASGITFKPAGVAYFNLVWNDEVLWDMVKGFGLALIAVFALLVANFRSFRWAIVGCVPLLFTILLIYGVVGFAGKDFDMPISVLSCLSLGMAVDFAIHFVGRLRQRLAGMEGADGGEPQTLHGALLWTAARPGRGILRNAVLFAAAFAVMLFAPLTPYVTVGAFIVAMMLLSALFTLLFVPALVSVLGQWLPGEAPPTLDPLSAGGNP